MVCLRLPIGLIALALVIPVFGQEEVKPREAPDAPFLTGVTDEASLRSIVDAHLRKADAFLGLVLQVEGPRTVDNTLLPYDRLWTEMETASGITSVLSRLHPDQATRSAAEALMRAAAAKAADLAVRPDVHAALGAIQLDGTDAETVRLVQRELRNNRLSGVDQPQATRERLRDLRAKLTSATQDFRRNLLNGQRKMVVQANELEGLPPDFLASRRPDTSGAITITTDDVDVQPVLMYARSDELRRRVQQERWSVATPANLLVLRRMLTLRHEIATILGFESWADYHAQSRMAGSAAAVSAFLDRVIEASRPKAAREFAELLERKRQDVPGATTLNPWDRTYYMERVRRASYESDAQQVRSYLPYAGVRDGAMGVARILFDVTFRPAPHLPIWHPDVEPYEVLQRGDVLGRVYLDAHPRPEKANSGASVSPVRRGARARQVPELVLTASVPGGRAPGPGLLSHEQALTIFHEFGHVMHAVLAGHGRWARLNGIDIEPDAGEAPSTMLEEWMWDPQTLARFARHHVTGEPIPPSLVQRTRAAGEFGRAMESLRTAVMSRIALRLHAHDAARLDPSELASEILGNSGIMRWADGTTVAQWPHMANDRYTSSFYTYLWSRVIAKDLFSRFDRRNLLAPEIAREYRDKVLAPGGSKPAAELFQEFLGRPFGFDAYAAWMNEER